MAFTRWQRLFAILLAVLATAGTAEAQRGPGRGEADQRISGTAATAPVASEHVLVTGGRSLAYRSEAGTIDLRDAKGEGAAHVFFVAHTLVSGDASRPVTFVFNGGPGAASGYLQLGAIGPRAVVFGENGEIPPAPQRLADNPDTWLDFTDLVFIDPVGTGYSRGADAEAERRYFGVVADAEATVAIIRTYLESHRRQGSPLFLAGESYGGFRAALLAHKLAADAGLKVSGAVLISPALELSLVFNPDPYNPLVWALMLPSMAAVRLESEGVHDRAGLAAGLAEAERFALGDYLLALVGEVVAGGNAVGARVAAFTGLSPEVVARQNGRVPVTTFLREFARASGKVLSRYDGAVAVPDPGNPRAADAVLGGATAAFASAFASYAAEELGYRTDLQYQLLNGQIAGRWDYGTTPTRQGFAGVLDDLEQARIINPAIEIMIAHGYTDLVTPYYATAYLVRRMLPVPGAAPVDLQGYAGGHMMYLRPQSRRELGADAARLYQRALAKLAPAPVPVPAP